MTKTEEQIPLITATPGTAEYQEQFEEQAQAASDQFLRHPIIRVACAVFCVGWVVVIIREFFVAQQTLLELFNLTLYSGLMIIELGRIATGHRAIITRYLLSGTQERIEESDRPG